MVALAAPAAACSTPDSQKSFLFKTKPDLQPGEVALSVQVITVARRPKLDIALQVRAVLSGHYPAATLRMQPLAFWNCDILPMSGDIGIVVGRLRPAGADGSLVLDPRRRPASLPRYALITPDDYPPEALKAREQGEVRAMVTFGEDGRGKACKIIRSTGSAVLDAATCRLLQRRKKITPPKDAQGRPQSSTRPIDYLWELPS